jgi:hypothetical protein
MDWGPQPVPNIKYQMFRCLSHFILYFAAINILHLCTEYPAACWQGKTVPLHIRKS